MTYSNKHVSVGTQLTQAEWEAEAAHDLSWAEGKLLLGAGAGVNPTEILPVRTVRKTADQTVNDSTTLVNDDDLLFPVGANEVWAFTMLLRSNTSAVADIKYAFTVPTGGAVTLYRGAMASVLLFDGTGPTTFDGAGADREYVVMGLYRGGANAGNLQLQWAQNTQEATNTRLLANSCLLLWRLA